MKSRLINAAADVTAAGDALYVKRNMAVHEGNARVEQPDATRAIRAMHRVLDHLVRNVN